MHLFVNNMADPDISDYEFDPDDLFRRCKLPIACRKLKIEKYEPL
jgi:hypothetical protein